MTFDQLEGYRVNRTKENRDEPLESTAGDRGSGSLHGRRGSRRADGRAGLSLAWPQSEFSEQVNFAWGGGARAGWAFNKNGALAPLLFADLGYLNYGRERRTEPFSMTIPDVVVDVVTDNYMLLVSPGFQIGSRRGRVRPYAETFFGLTYIATSTKIENHGLGGSDPIAESTNFSDFTWNFGVGGGLKIPVWRRAETLKKEMNEALIDLQFSYIFGGDAEYLKKGSIRRELGKVEYETVQSRTDMIQLRLGADFRF